MGLVPYAKYAVGEARFVDKESELAIIRRAYARQVLCDAETESRELEAAFSEVRREDYLGPGPWPLCRWEHYVWSPSDDPVYLYTNHPVGIDPDARVNNGQPSFHARLIAKTKPVHGEHVVHIGAGVGYYSAILATLVGPTGKVTAIEYDGDLAKRCRENLSRFSTVTTVHGNGAEIDIPSADIVYINAGVTRPESRWLDAMVEGGRMILPLTTSKGFSAISPKEMKQHGGVFLIQRCGEDFAARMISPVAIIPAEGIRDDESEKLLTQAFANGPAEKVAQLYRRPDIPEDRCWLRAADWCPTYD